MKKLLSMFSVLVIASGATMSVVACGNNSNVKQTTTINIAQATSDGNSIILFLNPDKSITDVSKLALSINDINIKSTDFEMFSDNKRIKLLNQTISYDSKVIVNYNAEVDVTVDTSEIPQKSGTIISAIPSINGGFINLTLAPGVVATNDDFTVDINSQIISHTYDASLKNLALSQQIKRNDVVHVGYRTESKILLDTFNVTTTTIQSATSNVTGQVITLVYVEGITPPRDDLMLVRNGAVFNNWYYAPANKQIFIGAPLVKTDNLQVVYKTEDPVKVDLSAINDQTTDVLVGGAIDNNRQLVLLLNPLQSFDISKLGVMLNDSNLIINNDFDYETATTTITFHQDVMASDKIVLSYAGQTINIDTSNVPDIYHPTLIDATINEQGDQITLTCKAGVILTRDDFAIYWKDTRNYDFVLSADKTQIILTGEHKVQKGDRLTIQYKTEDPLAISTANVNPASAPSIEAAYMNTNGDKLVLVFKAGSTAQKGDLSIYNNDVELKSGWTYDSDTQTILFSTAIIKNDLLNIIYGKESAFTVDTSNIRVFEPVILGTTLDSGGRILSYETRAGYFVERKDLVITINQTVIDPDTPDIYSFDALSGTIIFKTPLKDTDTVTVQYLKQLPVKVDTSIIFYSTIYNALINPAGTIIKLEFKPGSVFDFENFDIICNSESIKNFVTYNQTENEIIISEDYGKLSSYNKVYLIYGGEKMFLLDTSWIV